MGTFTHTKLNQVGADKVKRIETGFELLFTELGTVCPAGRELALVKTKMQEASYWAKKAVCEDPANQG